MTNTLHRMIERVRANAMARKLDLIVAGKLPIPARVGRTFGNRFAYFDVMSECVRLYHCGALSPDRFIRQVNWQF